MLHLTGLNNQIYALNIGKTIIGRDALQCRIYGRKFGMVAFR